MQLQYVQLITNKATMKLMQPTCEVVYSQFYSVLTGQLLIQNLLPFHKFSQTLANREHYKGSTELYCHFIVADSIVDAISFIISSGYCSVIRKTEFPQIRIWLWPDLSSLIRPEPAVNYLSCWLGLNGTSAQHITSSTAQAIISYHTYSE